MAGSASEEDVKNIVIKRFDAIKNKDEGAVRSLLTNVIASLMIGLLMKDRRAARPLKMSLELSRFSQIIVMN